jgi:hypothetical protein
MARQEDRCSLHAVSGGMPEEALLQTERWIDEGGSFERAV